ncbi:MAG: type II secretion system F family protein [Tenericutes bacterium]|nr:type II secretion system F family protein [Mycoplasmatota bacterium]
MGNSLLKKIYRKKEIDNIEASIKMLGERSNMDAITFMNIRYFTTLLVFLFILYVSNFGYILAPLISVVYYYMFHYVLIKIPIKNRIRDLDHQALYFFEILTLTLESGKNLENSLEITVFNVDSELSREFKRALFEMKFGKTLIEALEDMKKKIPSETVNNILLNITQTNVFGNSILDTMNNQISFLREKQILEIKGEMNKIPNKVSILSVLFVVPLILLLVLGPFVISLIG